MRQLTLAVILGVAAQFAVFAHTASQVEKKCPLCKTAFKAWVDMSGTSFGMRLDLKRTGPIAQPWRLPVCPQCKFVLFDDDIADEDLAKCKTIVACKDYKKHAARASYYLLGRIYEGLGKDSLDIGHTFLKASWQEEKNEKQLKEDLELSLAHFDKYLEETAAKKDAKKGQGYATAQLLKGELLRRLSKFDDAKKHLKEIKKEKAFLGSFLGDIVDFELALCEKKDAKPHEVSEVKETKKTDAEKPAETK